MDVYNISLWSSKKLKSFIRFKSYNSFEDRLGSLIYATRYGMYNTVKTLLENNIISKRENIGYGPLHEAVIRENIKIIDLLLIYGFRIDDEDDSELTPIDYAIKSNNVECFKIIINKDKFYINEIFMIYNLMIKCFAYNSSKILSYLLSLNVIKEINTIMIRNLLFCRSYDCLQILLEYFKNKNILLNFIILIDIVKIGDKKMTEIANCYQFDLYNEHIKKILLEGKKYLDIIVTKHLYYKLILKNVKEDKKEIVNDIDKIIDNNEEMKKIKTDCMKELNILKLYVENKNKYGRSLYMSKITTDKELTDIFPIYHSYVYKFVEESNCYLKSIKDVSKKLTDNIEYLNFDIWHLVSLYLEKDDITNVLKI
ncbi:ankyrin repeat protein [Brazilian porcupinepox virus 1]|nr:ankyrin repeat protein [Brazilian porcupinepox virus 1]